MANLSDLVGIQNTGAPDLGVSKLTSVFAGRGAFDYSTGSTFAAGKYALKCHTNNRGILRFSGNGNQETVFSRLSGTDTRGAENQAVIDLPNTATTLSASFESFDREVTPMRRQLPQWFPGNTGFTGTETAGNSNSLSLYGSSRKLASTPDGKVQVAVGGHSANIFASRDYGNTWHNVGNYNTLMWASGGGNVTNETYSVEYFNGRFLVAGGPTGTLGMISQNGFDWEYSGDGNWTTTRTAHVSSPNATNPIGAYIFGRHTTSSNVGISFDGQHFTLFSPSGLVGNVTKVWHDGTRFMAFDEGSRMATSLDGTLWNAAYSIPFVCRDIETLGSTYYAISETGIIFTSTDLTTWTQGSSLSSNTYRNHQLRKVGSTLVYYDPVNGQVRTSTNGTSWFTRADGLNQNGTLDVDSLGKLWYRQGTAALSYYAPAGNPIAWNRNVHPNQTATIFTLEYGVGSGGGRWVAGMNSGFLMSSPDGYTWTERTSTFVGGNNFVGQPFRTIRFLNNLFIAVGGLGSIAWSADGDNWTRVAYNGGTSPITNANMRSVSFGAGRYVVANDSGFIYTSTDLITWTQVAAGSNPFHGASAVQDITFANNQFVAVGANASICTSADGLTWTRRSPLRNIALSSGGTVRGTDAESTTLKSVAYGTTTQFPSGVWVVLGDSGVVQYSTNGTDFRNDVKINLFQSGVGTRVRNYAGRFWFTADNGYLAWSTDLQDFWQISSGHLTQTVEDITFNSVSNILMTAGGNGQLTWAHRRPDQTTLDYDTFTYSLNIGIAPSTQYGGAMIGTAHSGDTVVSTISTSSGAMYVFLNDNAIWRTYDFMEYLPYVHNRVAQGSALTDIVGGNGMFVARSNGNSYFYYSPDGNRWNSIRRFSRNVDPRGNAQTLCFEEGYFWKLFNNSIQRSNDGRTWHSYYTFPAFPFSSNLGPTRIKRTGGVWFGYTPSTSAGSGPFVYNQDLLRNPRNWKTSSINVGSMEIRDIAGTDDFWIWLTNDRILTANNPAASNNYTVRIDNGNSQAGGHTHAWDIGGKIFTQNGTIYEAVKDFGGSIQTTASSVWLAMLQWTNESHSDSAGVRPLKSGNMVFGYQGNDPIIFDASAPVGFSIFNSTSSTVN